MRGVGGGSCIPDLIPVRHGQATNICPQYRQLQEGGNQLAYTAPSTPKTGIKAAFARRPTPLPSARAFSTRLS